MPQIDNATPHSASVYDQQVNCTIPYYDCFHLETINLIKALKINPQVWLDTGCGTGTLVAKALNHFPKTLFLLADPSAEMLTQARQKLSVYGQTAVRFLGSIISQTIDLSGKHADVITAILSHHYLIPEKRRQAVQQCFDLLAPGGVLVTFENIRPFTSQGIETGKAVWANFQFAQGKNRQAITNHLNRFDQEYFPITITEHLQLLKECGFQAAELLWYSYLQAGFYGLK
jgi:tRNA (cmo5U34)-methyltransferase